MNVQDPQCQAAAALQQQILTLQQSQAQAHAQSQPTLIPQGAAAMQGGVGGAQPVGPLMMNVHDLPNYLHSQGRRVYYTRRPEHQQPKF